MKGFGIESITFYEAIEKESFFFLQVRGAVSQRFQKNAFFGNNPDLTGGLL